MESQIFYPAYSDYKLSQMPLELRQLIRAEMQPGEALRWVGQPRSRTFLLATIPAVLFGIPWTAFSIFWTVAAAGFALPSFDRIGWSLIFPLWGVPFILIGFCMLSSPFWAMLAARRTAYVITDRRAIIFDWGWNRTVRSVQPSSFKGLYRREKRDGWGDIILSETVARDSDGDRTRMEVSFVDVENVRDVEKLLKGVTQK
jgi:hypothetical protein